MSGVHTAERWKQLYLLAREITEAPADQRQSRARELCAEDDALLAEVLEIARQSASDDDFLNFSPVGAAPVAQAGRRIGPWRVTRELGRGGMGQVLLAERDDGQFFRQVAIKLVNGFAVGELRERLLRERQILADLEHPGIARLLDGGETEDGSPYLVMEYVEGSPLDAWRAAEKPSIPRILRLFPEVCAAVEFAHRNMVVHRDLKPSNILVTSEGHARLLDFGIAKLLENQGSGSDFTVAGSGQMSMAYASPEQVDGRRVTTSTDVYSLGVVLYELLTGQLPCRVKGLPVLDAIRTICNQEPIPAGHLNREIRGDLEAIVARALEKDPYHRYSSVQDFRRDIERFLDGRAIHARPATWFYRTRKIIRRNLWQCTGAAILIAVIGAGAAATLIQNRRANQRTAEVRELANRMLSGYMTKLADLPGSGAVQRQMADDAARYLDRLASEAPNSDDLAREVAAGYHLLADLQGAGNAHIGDFAGAMRSIERALAIRESLLRQKPRDVARQFDLAYDLRPLSTLYMNLQDPRVDATSSRMLAILDGLPTDWRNQTRVMELLSTALSHRTWVLGSAGRLTEALAIEERRLSICRRLAAAEPNSLSPLIRLADAHMRFSVDLFEANRLDESIAEAQRGVNQMNDAAHLAATAPPATQRFFRYMQGAAYKAVGKPELLRGHFKDAEKALADAGRFCEALVVGDPAERRSANCLAEALLWQARAMQLSHDPGLNSVARHYESVALASFGSTHEGEDADPFDVELWEQAAAWKLPLSATDEKVLLGPFTRLAPLAKARKNWERLRVAAHEWKGTQTGHNRTL